LSGMNQLAAGTGDESTIAACMTEVTVLALLM